MPLLEPVPKALVVDDDPIMLGLLELYLSRAGYQAITAKDATHAVALTVQYQPAIILMDVMLPELSGLAALRHLRQTTSTKDIPVIVMSANDHPETKAEALAAGAITFLVKPFSLAQLLREVRRALGERS